MQDDFLDASIEDFQLITVGSESVRIAETLIVSCEACNPADTEIPFDWLLAEVTGKRGPVEFVLGESARCPNCGREVTEKTLVEPEDG